MNAPTTPKSIPMPQPVAGLTARQLQLFLSAQLLALSHYAVMSKEQNESEQTTHTASSEQSGDVKRY